MAESNRITMIIEGMPEDGGRVRFKTFLDQLQSLSATISRLDREYAEGREHIDFQIAELSYNSPVRVVLEPKPLPHAPVIAAAIIDSFRSISDAIDGDGDLSRIDSDLLADFRALARPVGKQVKSAALRFDGGEFNLTERVFSRTDQALAVTDECDGSFDGMLEQINIHLGANTFHIYPAIGPKKIACNFPAALYDDAVAAVGRRVEVTGLLRYRSGADFPHQILVQEIEVFPNDDELPNWEDIRGIAPDATGILRSEAFVRELRDAWF
jgi:hypothetical protein